MRKATSKMSMLTHMTQFMGTNGAIAPMIVPPDGGWGWVIVLVGLVSSTLTDGIQVCFYLFREPMCKELSIEPSDISFLSALNTSFYFIGGVLACSVGNHFGFRITMIIGGFGASATFASGYVFKEMIYFYIVIGVIGGTSSGFIAVAATLPPGFYFDKKRSIAMGLVSCGSGLGGLIMPQIIKVVLIHYGWRTTFLIEACIMSSMILLGLLLRPLKPVMVIVSPAGDEALLRRDDYDTFSEFRVIDHGSLSMAPSILLRSTAVGDPHPTITQMMDLNDDLVNIRVGNDPHLKKRLEELAQPRRASRAATVATIGSLTTIGTVGITLEPCIKEKLPWYKCGCCRSVEYTIPSRPLQRTDLFYTGNIKRLDEYNETVRDLDYHLQVTRVPTYYQIIQDFTRTYTTWCFKSVLTGLSFFVDYSLIKSPSFICLCLSGFSIYVAFYLPFLYTSIHLKGLGEEEYDSVLVSSIGLGTMIGRLMSGLVLTALPKIGARHTVSFTSFLGALSSLCFLAYDDLYFKGACLFVFGSAVGFFTPLRSIIIVDFFGLGKLTSATGMVILCLGGASLAGPPIAEAATDLSKDYNAPFYVCGLFLFLGCIALWPMKILSKWEQKRAKRRSTTSRRRI